MPRAPAAGPGQAARPAKHAVALAAQTPQTPPAAAPQQQQPDPITTTIVGAPGLPPKIAVPDFVL